MTSKKVHFALIVLSAMAAIYFDGIGNHTLFSFLKPLTTILILLVPILHGIKMPRGYYNLTIAALIFCLIGDVFLLDSGSFVYGLGTFLIAHILFLLSFRNINGLKFYVMPIVLLLLIGGSYFFYLSSDLGDMKLPVFLYFVFIVMMCWQGVNLYIWRREKAYGYIAIAVLLFIISDSFIALNKFKFAFELSGLIILSTYWAAIFLLAYATTLPKSDIE